jgi:hypothetical protein
MSQDVSVRENRGSSLRRGTTFRRRCTLNAARPRWHRQGNLVHRERKRLDRYESQYLGMDTPGRRQRSRSWFQHPFRSCLGAVALDPHRHNLGVCEPQVPPVRAPVDLNDHVHGPAGGPLSRLSDFAVHASRRAFSCVGRDLGANQGISKRSRMIGRVFDEIERGS